MKKKLSWELHKRKLDNFIQIFENGLKTKVSDNTDNISLGQKQLINFIRAILRDPELLIMDEATANIDTITEKHLNQIIDQLPNSTTKVIIAHRLNTIKNADEVFFINGGKIRHTADFDEVVSLINTAKQNN